MLSPSDEIKAKCCTHGTTTSCSASNGPKSTRRVWGTFWLSLASLLRRILGFSNKVSISNSSNLDCMRCRLSWAMPPDAFFDSTARLNAKLWSDD